MKKRILSLLLCTLMFCTLFYGCDMTKEKMGYDTQRSGQGVKGESVTMNREGFFYEEADANASVTGMFTGGTKVYVTEKQEIDGRNWGYTEKGWVCLDEDYTEIVFADEEYIVNVDSADVLEEPGYDSAVKYTRNAGERVRISQKTTNGQWGMTTDRGWIELSSVAPFKAESHYAVVREGGTYLCAKPGDIYYGSSELKVADRITLQYSVEIDSVTWWYSSGKWVDARDIYIEGEIGNRPASGKVIDTTPLNVRRGPTKRYQAVDKIPVGDHVAVMEQIDCGGNNGTWGYTGKGWIYMPLVEIESNTYNP